MSFVSIIIIHCYFKMYFVLNVEYKSYSPEALWRYLTARHDWFSITLWIGEFQTRNSYASLQQNKWPPLTVDVVDQNTRCNNYMRNEILDTLARYCKLWGCVKGRTVKYSDATFPLKCHKSNATLFHNIDILKLKGHYCILRF